MLFDMPKPAPFTGVTVITIPPHPLLGGMGKLYCVVIIPHRECSVTEEVEFIAPTQYAISIIVKVRSSVNGAVHVR